MRTTSADTAVIGVAVDSREVAGGYLFVALPGERTDGHEFLGEPPRQEPRRLWFLRPR